MGSDTEADEKKIPHSVNGLNSSKNDLEAGEAGLDRTLASRHLQFIAIGGTIGTVSLSRLSKLMLITL